jgi:two-component system, NarL family, sensor kinase
MPDKLSEVVLILVGSTMIILVLTALVITALFINQKRKFRHNLEMSDLKNEYDRELLRTQLEIQSQTFETISRELHDNIGTLLSIALVHIKSVTENNTAEHEKLSEVNGLLNEAMDTLRDISKSLNSETITRVGWQRAFFSELQRIGKSNLFIIETSVTGEPFDMEDNKQIILFRILQEAMNNIVKHSEAEKVFVGLQYSENEMNVTITDNGKGIAKEAGSASTGSGLRNMQARAALLPAQLEIDGHAGKGTSIRILYKRNHP